MQVQDDDEVKVEVTNPGIYVVCSDDPLLKLDLTQNILQQARDLLPDADFLLYTNSDLAAAGGSANLKDLENEMSDPGLFGGDRIIKINLKDLDSTAIEVFKLVAASLHLGIIIIVDMPRINASYLKSPVLDPSVLRRYLSFAPDSAGGAALQESESGKKKKTKKTAARGLEARKKEAIGYLRGVNAWIKILYSKEGEELKRWIKKRGGKYSINIAKDAVDFIAKASDNNLLSIDHALQVISLTRGSNDNTQINLSLKDVEDYFTQDARYNGFELPQAVMQGDSIKALNIISSFCTGQGSSMTSALSLLIGRMDEALTTVYDGKVKFLNQRFIPNNEYFAFFMSHNVKVPAAQEAYKKAIASMDLGRLDFMTKCLSEATEAYSHFDTEGAYRALQRIAIAADPSNVQAPCVKFLASDVMH